MGPEQRAENSQWPPLLSVQGTNCCSVIPSHPAKPKRSAAWLEEPPTQMPSCPDRASSEKDSQALAEEG
ncbi:Immunoglobulin Lambda Variable 3-16 [Manis pentadactyla]|nr:Immunoglobulin Lambda Variable 3-16 [Manis pentadactyla]